MKKFFVILSLLVGVSARADILIEPYLGYHNSTAEQTGAADADISGMGYGARLGWTLPLVFIALDYSAGSLDYEQSGTETDSDYKAMGVVVGASLPFVRVWAGYNFSVESEVTPKGSILAIDAKGTGMKAGLGFKIPVIPISLNVEYLINEFDESNGVSLTNNIDNKGIFISLSAPLTF